MFDLTSPSSAFTGKILSTSRLYLGRNAEQQPQQPWRNQRNVKTIEIIRGLCQMVQNENALTHHFRWTQMRME